MVLTKYASDVNWTVSVKRQRPVTSVPGVAIAVSGNGGTDSKIFNTLAELVSDYPENTQTYKLANAIFNASGYNSPIEVIKYDSSSTPTTPQVSNGSVSTSEQSGIVQTVGQHIYDGFRALLVADGTDDDVKAIADYCYNANRVAIFVQKQDKASAVDLAKYFAKAHTGSNLDNTFVICNGKSNGDVAGQVAGYMVGNVRASAERITNQNSYVVDDALSAQDNADLNAVNVAYVVNKAGDLLLSGGKTPAGNYVDQFTKTQYVVDQLTQSAQKWLNRYEFVQYDDEHINEFKSTLQATGDSIFGLGILENKINITLPDYASIALGDISKRALNGAVIDISISNGIDTVNGKLNLTI